MNWTKSDAASAAALSPGAVVRHTPDGHLLVAHGQVRASCWCAAGLLPQRALYVGRNYPAAEELRPLTSCHERSSLLRQPSGYHARGVLLYFTGVPH